MVIKYHAGPLQLGAICQLRGSVFPQASAFGFISFILALALGLLRDHMRDVDLTWLNYPGAYGSFTITLGFLLVFRNQVAYQRFWEAETLMQVLRGQWAGAFGSILSFSKGSKSSVEDIRYFRLKLIRVFSSLHACTLDYIFDMPHGSSPIVGIEGLDDPTLRLMHIADDEALIFVHVQWIQQMVLEAMQTGVIPTPPPIVSRIFQDLSQGVVTVNNARKISCTPFPFPYCQALQGVLIIHTLVAPMFCVLWIQSVIPAAIYAFIIVSVMHMLNFISAEIENPFGDDLNDLDRDELQEKFNRTLVTMSSPGATHTPMLREEQKTSDVMSLPKILRKADNHTNAFIKTGQEYLRTKYASPVDALFEDFREILEDDPDSLQKARKSIVPTGVSLGGTALPTTPREQTSNVADDANGGSGEDPGGGAKKVRKKAAPQPIHRPPTPVGRAASSPAVHDTHANPNLSEADTTVLLHEEATVT